MEEILEQAKRVAEEAEVFRISRSETDAVFEANRLKQVQSRQTSGKALRLVKEGRIGLSATNRANGAAELVEMAAEVAAFGAEAKFDFPNPESYPAVDVYDPAIEDVPAEQMVNLGQSLIDAVRQHTPELVCDGSVSKTVFTVEIANTRGGKATLKKSVFGFGIEGVLIRGTDMLFVGDTEGSCHPFQDPKSVIATTIEQLERAKDTVSAPVGQIPVIFTPHGVASAFMPALATAINGKTVVQGASPLGNRKGERVFDPKLTLVDDPLIGYRPGSRCCDAEGVPSQRTPIIDGGVVSNFLFDLQTAALAQTASTGSAARDLASLPSPSFSNIVIEDGETSFEDMLAGIGDGLIVELLMGAGQGNVLSGEFSGNVLLGYAVKGGRIAGRVKDTMVYGNIYEALKDVLAVGRDGRWLGGRMRTPSICCPRVAVSTQE